MWPIINDLLHLWEEGILVSTPKNPNGRQIHAVLLCIVCDVTAAHKLGGFGSHSHMLFCPCCWIAISNKQELTVLTPNGTFLSLLLFMSLTDYFPGFPLQSNAKHHRQGNRYWQLTSKAQQEKHANEFLNQWTELAWLPYFNLTCMIVINPKSYSR